MEIFEEAYIGEVRLKNRIIRSATFEGAADANGFPTEAYYHMYKHLAQHDVAAVITGFAYVTRNGKAMQPGQAGCDSPDKLDSFLRLTEILHQYDCKAFLQIAHTGRQTLSEATGCPVVGVSAQKSAYFKEKPDVLSIPEIYGLIDSFGKAALLAQQGGFDGIQLHAAHGYLIHQFLHPGINNRTDEFKLNSETGIGTFFLQKIIENIREKCGRKFPVLVKISGSDDLKNHFTQSQFLSLIDFLDFMQVAAIEISYGTMDAPFNIFRGDFPSECILAENYFYRQRSPLYKWVARNLLFPSVRKKYIELQPMYNLPFAITARAATQIPIIAVGGFKRGEEIRHAIHDCQIDFVSLCRPFIAEPNLVTKLKENPQYESICQSCNQCAVMCDSQHPTRCYTHATLEVRHNSSFYSEQNLITTQ